MLLEVVVVGGADGKDSGNTIPRTGNWGRRGEGRGEGRGRRPHRLGGRPSWAALRPTAYLLGMRRLAALSALVLGLLATARPLRAGGGPETTVVVVNADSPTSRRVAHTYARLRGIPASHLIDVPGVPSLGIVPLEVFRERLWAPVKKALEERGLLETTDLLAWSADFPFAVDVAAEAKEKGAQELPHVPFRAALTSLTYLWRLVEAHDARAYLDLGVNRYLARERAGAPPVSRGFRASAVWNPAGEVAADTDIESPHRYLLSVMLGYTGTFGNDADEVLACLERAAASDGTNPDGTVYLLQNDDVRATTRAPFFEAAVSALTAMGRKAVVLSKGKDGQDGVLPKGKDDVLGAVLGFAGFTWKDAGSRMLPGCIAEHLTSFGADFSHGGQTKIAELLRGGAAGSSGTVAEPLALWQKFPLPTIHVHYAAGCSLAEAFYQSLAGPFQTLVVGDPLARPFAHFGRVALPPAGPEPLRGTVEVLATVEPAPLTRVGRLELWVDGRRRATAAPEQPLAWDTTVEDDGPHEVRVVAVEAGPIETRSSGTGTRVVANAGRSVTLSAAKPRLALDGEAALGGKAADALEVEIRCGARVLATVPVKGGSFKASVPAALLGLASPPLVARARWAAGPRALSAPLALEVEPRGEARLPALKPTKPVKPPKAGKDGKVPPPPAPPVGRAGLTLVAVDAKNKRHEGTVTDLGDEALKKALDGLGAGDVKRIELEGEIEVAEDGLYQLVFTASGPLSGRLGTVAFEAHEASPTRAAFALAPLTQGWNPLRLVLEVPAGTVPRLSALLAGHAVATPLVAKSLRQGP